MNWYLISVEILWKVRGKMLTSLNLWSELYTASEVSSPAKTYILVWLCATSSYWSQPASLSFGWSCGLKASEKERKIIFLFKIHLLDLNNFEIICISAASLGRNICLDYFHECEFVNLGETKVFKCSSFVSRLSYIWFHYGEPEPTA